MSMLSSQVEEIRNAATTYRMLGRHTLANVLLEAADSITELRGALQVASADYRHLSEENDKLRELVRDMFTTISWCSLDCYPSDNKKRELVDRMHELGVEVDG